MGRTHYLATMMTTTTTTTMTMAYMDSSNDMFSGVMPEAMAHPSNEAKRVISGGLVGGMPCSKSAVLLLNHIDFG